MERDVNTAVEDPAKRSSAAYCFSNTLTDGSREAFGPRLVDVAVIVLALSDRDSVVFPVGVPSRLKVSSMVFSSTALAETIVPEITVGPVTGVGLPSKDRIWVWP